jgi:hypothetical protein
VPIVYVFIRYLAFLYTPPLMCAFLVRLTMAFAGTGWAKVGRYWDGKVAVDEARYDFDHTLRGIIFTGEDGADCVAQVQITVIGVPQYLNGECPSPCQSIISEKGEKGHSRSLGRVQIVPLVPLLNLLPHLLKGIF